MSLKTVYSMKAALIDYARPNRYEVEILPPDLPNLDLGKHKDLRKIMLNCNAAEIPGRILGVGESRVGGPIRRLPYDRIYNPVTLGFYSDVELQEWNFFNSWMDGISEKSIKQETDASNFAQTPSYNQTRYFEYYNNYIGQVSIGQLDMLSTQSRVIKLVEAYPVNISAISYSYESGDAVQTFNVTFQFREFKVEEGLLSLSTLTDIF